MAAVIAARKWHGFGMFGMGGKYTDYSESGFSLRVKALGVNIHNSPYNQYEAGDIAAEIDRIPGDEGVFVWGTSLGANNCAVVASYVHRKLQGIFGFQASIYGAKGYQINRNVLFAHLIYSYTIIPFPGLGAYKWPQGTIPVASYVRTPHHIAHPGDYDVGDQNTFLSEMKHIMEHTG